MEEERRIIIVEKTESFADRIIKMHLFLSERRTKHAIYSFFIFHFSFFI